MKYNKQQLFDLVVAHATKGEKCLGTYSHDKSDMYSEYYGSDGSGDKTVCMYRNNGKKCFIGAVIPDELYVPKYEGRVGSLLLEDLNIIVHEVEEYDTGNWYLTIQKLVDSLQRVHDELSVCEWSMHLERIAREFKLNINQEHLEIIKQLH